jgi:hypothetical protein
MLLASLAAQVRHATIGNALGTDRQPLAGASVTFVAELQPGFALCPPDVVAVTADAQGRFRAELLPTLEYSAWCIGAARADGRRQISPAIEEVTAGTVCELRATSTATARKLRIDGVAPWAGVGPLSGRVLVVCGNTLALPVPIQADGTAELPPLPRENCWFDVLDAHGEVLQAFEVAAGNDDVPLRLWPPVEVPCKVVDAQGKPVAGAVLRQQTAMGSLGDGYDLLGSRWRDEWRTLATTGADGAATLRVPAARNPFTPGDGELDLLFAAEKQGWLQSIGGWRSGGFFRDCKGCEPDNARELVFTLATKGGLGGQLLLGPQQPLTAHRVALFGSQQLAISPGAVMTFDRVCSATTDAEGRFAFPSLPPLTDAQLTVAPLPGALPVTGHASTRAARVPGGFALGGIEMLSGTLPPVALDRLCNFTLQAVDKTDGPAANCRATMIPIVAGALALGAGNLHYRVDTAGRATIRVAPGRWLLFATDFEGYCAKVLEFGNDDQELRIAMQPMATMAGKLQLPDGVDATQARFAVRTYRSQGGGADNEVARLLQPRLFHINDVLVHHVKIERDGAFECHFIPAAGRSFGFLVTCDGRQAGPIDLVETTEAKIEMH